MTKVISSQTSNAKYFLSIDDVTGEALDCSCPDRHFRHHVCKHITQFDAALDKTLAFAALRQRYDVRSQTQRELRRAAYNRYEMSLGVL